MIRKIDPLGRITISLKWFNNLSDSRVIVSVKEGTITIQPYDPKKHNLEVLLYRRLDDHSRIKLSPDIFRAAGLSTKDTQDIFIAPDNKVLIRKLGDYCDSCGMEAKTQAYKRRKLCQQCIDKLKRCE